MVGVGGYGRETGDPKDKSEFASFDLFFKTGSCLPASRGMWGSWDNLVGPKKG